MLFDLCCSFSEMTGIPVSVYDADKMIFISDSYAVYTALLADLQKRMQPEKENFSLLYFDQIFIAGGFLTDRYPVILGPVLTAHISEEGLSSLLKDHLILLQDKKVIHQLTYEKICLYQRFMDSLNFFYKALNHRIPIVQKNDSTEISALVEAHMPEEYEIEWAEYNDEFVDQMQRYIENGMVDELNAFMKEEQPAPYGTLSKDVLRHYKNSCFVLLYIVRKAAEKGGLESTIGLRLAEGYSQRIDAALSANELRDITIELRRDYCKRVYKQKENQSYSPLVRKMIQYIHTNNMKKLSLDHIAKDIGISKSHMCALFKQETGKNIGEFIQEEKIRTAKDLLRFSEYSIIDISNYLSFSSQCYFQNVFKKVTGMTPKQYRTKVRK